MTRRPWPKLMWALLSGQARMSPSRLLTLSSLE